MLYFVSDGELFDARLIHIEVTRLFTQCNLPDELDEHNQLTKEFRVLDEDEENDEDENEICYNEFCKVSKSVSGKVIRATRLGRYTTPRISSPLAYLLTYLLTLLAARAPLQLQDPTREPRRYAIRDDARQLAWPADHPLL